MSSLSASDLQVLEYYWQDAGGEQMGPSPVSELQGAWKAKQLHANCYIYGDGFEDWVTIESLPLLKGLIAPKPAPPKKKGPPPPKKKKKGGWTKKMTCDNVPYFLHTSTGELTWNEPNELKEDASEGNWVWLPDADEGWIAGCALGGRMYRTSKGDVKVKKSELLPLDYGSLSRLHDDLVLLDSLDEGLILHTLRERYSQDEIYTGIGGILIAINPFQRLPLYTTALIEAYHKAGNKPMAPHPYKLADAAHKALLDDLGNQSILVSGESGSGKTETTKQCLSFLAEVAGSNDVEQRVLSANPLLESFGNAKTTRNDNSSRFGRYTSVEFDNQLRIAGASIQNYLLEKSRVKGQSADERNYHIFYQLCAAQGKDAGSYNYLCQCLTIQDVDDQADFHDVVEAMSTLNCDESILDIVSAILDLGQIQFEPLGGMSDGCRVIGDSVLLGADLSQALTTRTLNIRGSTTTAQLRVEQALENRDALAKFIYANLFDDLVSKINKALKFKHSKAFVGILDIFGFEIFEINSFEQLCINFTNEKLQQLFNEHTFKTEALVYEQQGVEFPPIAFIDNQPVCDLIEKRGGIFTVLDDTLKGPGKNKDHKFSQTVDLIKSDYFIPANEHRVQGAVFSIKHYAGLVCYSCDGMVEKNADTLYPDLYQVMSNSSISSMFPIVKKEKATLGASFKKQLVTLMESLRKTEPHYIRCIKPNQSKLPRTFEGSAVLEQLTCAGVFEAVKIRKSGYPFRFTYDRFVARYKSLMSTNSGWLEFDRSFTAKQKAEAILEASKQPFPHLQRGKTMLLFRADEYRILELCRALAADRVSAKIQAKARGKLTRRYLDKVKTVRPQLQKALKSRDLKTLEAALRLTDKALGVFARFEVSVPIAEWKAAKEMVQTIKEAVRLAQMLETACEPDDLAEEPYLEALFRTLTVDCSQLAAKMPVEPSFDQWYEYAMARFTNAREERLAPKFEQVMKQLEREPMSELYAEAKKLQYESPHLQEIEKLVEMNEEQLLKKQYQRAHETGQADRAREKEIALKEVYLTQYSTMFAFERCALLRDPDEYNAAAGIFTSSKKEKKNTMLQYSKHKLLTSLTRLDVKLTKEALKVYRSIMGYCGEKRTYASSDLCAEIVAVGLSSKELRPEIYCQLMKQLSGNESPESSAKAWALFLMCLLVFPPQPELENYVHIFIRKNAPVDMRKALTKAAHNIAYQDKLMAQPPSIDALNTMLDDALGGRAPSLRRKDSMNR